MRMTAAAAGNASAIIAGVKLDDSAICCPLFLGLSPPNLSKEVSASHLYAEKRPQAGSWRKSNCSHLLPA